VSELIDKEKVDAATLAALTSNGKNPMKSVLMVITMALAGQMAVGEVARHSGARILESGGLRIEVMDPAQEAPYYKGQRFTPLAAVLRASLDGHEFFFNPVEHDPMNHHAGLASEFDLTTSPPGYADAAEGDGFIKIGVGELKKKGQNYAFWNTYEVIKAAQTSVKWDKDAAAFKQTCKGVNGYAYELSANVKVAADRIDIDWSLKNTGTKPLATDTYVHNFFRFNDQSAGPDYVLSFPFDYKAGGLGEEQEQKGREILFKKEIPGAVNIEVPHPEGYKGENAFTLTHTKSGQALTGTTSVSSLRTAVHASKSYVCPEQFIHLEVEPGKETNWRRSYTFAVAR
jgi:hypothetical protein